MKALVQILLPYSLNLPKNSKFNTPILNDGHNGIRFLPLGVDQEAIQNPIDKITIDGQDSFEANVLLIEFYRDTFDRKNESSLDPSADQILGAANWFIERLRFVGKDSSITPLEDLGSINVKYTNDDGSELEKEEGMAREKLTRAVQFKYSLLTPEIWDNIFNLGDDFSVPHWHNILLDSSRLLPDIGPSLVLAETALEVFINYVLDSLSRQGDIPQNVWNWINERDWLKTPSVDERLDFLLQHFTNHSLKSEAELWEGYRNLKKARNSFAHEGIPKIGKDVVDSEKGKSLIRNVNLIVLKVREWLPEEFQWPVFRYKTKIELVQKLRTYERNPSRNNESDSASDAVSN
jgi:hypothetical protein